MERAYDGKESLYLSGGEESLNLNGGEELVYLSCGECGWCRGVSLIGEKKSVYLSVGKKSA